MPEFEKDARPCCCGIATAGSETVHGGEVISHRTYPVPCAVQTSTGLTPDGYNAHGVASQETTPLSPGEGDR